ncbi:MAG: sodium:solute symporter [Phycisphaerales bacterium]
MLTLAAGFAPLDWAVLALYFGVLVVTGLWFARRAQRDTDDYFLAARSMPAWAVAVSILATSLSAATFIGGPQQAYVGDLTYLSSSLGMMLAAIVIAVWFIPAFYRARVSTVYELLDTRFGPTSKRAASAMFMLGRVFASGARLFIVALPASLILFGEPHGADPIPAWQLLTAITLMTFVGIGYTLAGGISSVIWSDVLQTVVFLAAVVAAIGLLLVKIPVGVDEIARTLADAPGSLAAEAGSSGKLTAISLSTDPRSPYTLWAILIGFTLLGVGAYGTDQDLVQRMLTCRSARAGSWSVIASQIIGLPVVILFMLVGLLLFVYYQRPEVMGAAAPTSAPDDSRTIFLNFILCEMPQGMTGLMMAGLFAAGLSSLNSAINAMASTFVSDFYKHWAPSRDPRHYVLVGRAAVIAWGLLLGAFAAFCVFWQRESGKTLIDFALGVMVYAYSGLLGVYFTALFTRRGSTTSVLGALAAGFLAVLLMERTAWGLVINLDAPRASAELNSDHVHPLLFVLGLAFPWKLAIATTIATGVCLLGSGQSKLALNIPES